VPLHLAARVHAFVHSLFRSSDEAEARALYEAVKEKFDAHGLLATEARQLLAGRIAESVADDLGIESAGQLYPAINQFVVQMFAYEQFYLLPDIDWTERRSVSEWWALREALNKQKGYLDEADENLSLIESGIRELLRPIVGATSEATPHKGAEEDLSVSTTLVHTMGAASEVFDTVLGIGFAKDLAERSLFSRLRDQLERNLVAASGGNPEDVRGFTKAPVMPSKSSEKDASGLAAIYLASTPLIDFLGQSIDFTIPIEARFEHSHIVAGSGHGKTQTLQYLICQDLPAVARGERSIIVLDSQGDLIQNIAHLAEFAPGGQLHDRVVIIDPSDVEWPVSLNLFDVGIERLQGYEPLERERLTNSILELYDFVLGTLLAAEMTQKQNVIFRYVTRLMLHIPDATIHTLRELMEPDSYDKFKEHIDKLSGTARHFFETEFQDKEFTQTKKQVLRRLWGILENQTFERMFSHPRSKLDLFKEMNSGKVILINTAKDLLKEQGSQIFGRFFIALVAQAAQERATMPVEQRLSTFVYIDEAADYFDRNIGIILAQARKYRVGMVLAHQYLGQLDPKLQDAFAANTSIKLAGGVSAKDARILAQMLYCQPELIERQHKGAFASYVRGHTTSAIPLSFPLGYLEEKPRMSTADWEKLRDLMRSRHAIYYTELEEKSDKQEKEEATIEVEQEEQSSNAARNPDDIDTEPGAKW
jgi:hypothetical protein